MTQPGTCCLFTHRSFQAVSGTLVDGNAAFDLKLKLGMFAAGLVKAEVGLGVSAAQLMPS